MCKKELVKPNSSLSIKEIKLIISNFPTKKTLVPMASLVNSTKKERRMPIYTKYQYIRK